MRGTSMPDVGDYNEKLVLQAVRREPGGIAQSQLARGTGLSRQAVSLIARRLLAAGLIETAGTAGQGRGKPRTLLRVVPSAMIAAGVHIDPSQMTVVLLDLAGGVRAHRSAGPPGRHAAEDLPRILTALQEACDEAGVDGPGALLGTGIAAPGGLDTAAGTVCDPPWLPGWRGVPVTARIAAATGRPALLDKDTMAALSGELWATPGSEGTIVSVYVGAGVGSAVAVDGIVQRGASDQAGEIGHLPTGRSGRRCWCGREGCLSLFTDVVEVVAAAGLQDHAVVAADAPSVPAVVQAPRGHVWRGRGIDPTAVGAALREVVARARDGDDRAQGALMRHGDALGEALSILAAVHDPRRIVIGGPAWPAVEEFAMPRVRACLERRGGRESQVEIRSSRRSADVGAIGAASLVLERELAPPGRLAQRGS